MKKILILLVISVFIFFPCFANTQVRITGGVCFDTVGIPDFETINEELSINIEEQFWGIGWEVIFDKLGIGGNYYINFRQDESRDWTISWYSEVFYISYHFLGADFFIDPFCQAGLGNAGGVYLGGMYFRFNDVPRDRLTLSLFPYVSGGLALHFKGFLIGAKLNYTPMIGPVPLTYIPPFYLSDTQVNIFAGVSF